MDEPRESPKREDCLSEDVLAQLAEGTLDDAELEVAETHLSGCARCMRLLEETVETLDGVSALVAQAVRELDDVEPPVSSKSAAALERGTRIGRYEIIEPLGEGGMGRVYAARDTTLGRKIALKLLHARAATPDLESRLLREAKAMARLSCPEVIAIHDVGHHGDQLFIAMELVDGGTLRHWLAAAPRAWREVLAVFLRAGKGLAEAHAAGIVHRDFKPDNVLVGKDGRVRVTDFGLARTQVGDEAPESVRGSPAFGEASTVDALSSLNRPADAPLTQTGALLGTPAYMAPEQHMGAPADVRSDVYGFCVSLYEGLLGKRPFLGTTVAALHAQKVAGITAMPNDRGGVPERLLRVVLVGMRPGPDDRYPSMDTLVRALVRAERSPRWPWVLAAGAAAVTVGGVALGARHPKVVEPAATGAVVAVECTTNRACVEKHAGAPFVCRPDHTCASVASEDCEAKFEPEDLESEDTVWLGAMFPTKGAAPGDLAATHADVADFARREIARTTKSFAGTKGGQGVRRIALVTCDDSEDATRAARHLVTDVGVPAILGFRSGQELIDLAGSLLVPKKTVAVATLSSNPLVTRVPQPADGPRLIWRTIASFDTAGEVIARVIAEILEPPLRARAANEVTRVTLVRDDSPGAVSFGDRFYRQVRFNGRSALENGDAFTEVTYPAAGSDAAPATSERVAATRPSFVVLQGNSSHIPAIVDGIERQFPAGVPKPTYIWAFGTTESLKEFIQREPDRRRRVLAVNPVTRDPTDARFMIRYREERNLSSARSLSPSSTYDAFYLLAYATFVVGDAPVNGTALANAFARLVPPGRPIDVGPSDLFDAVSTLRAGQQIDLGGASTELDFDLSTGEMPSDFEVNCADLNKNGLVNGRQVSAGVSYRARGNALTGALRCR